MDIPVKFSVNFSKRLGNGCCKDEFRVYGEEFGFTEKEVCSVKFKYDLERKLWDEFGYVVTIKKIQVIPKEEKDKPHVWLTPQGWRAKLRSDNAIGSTPQEAIINLNEFLAR